MTAPTPAAGTTPASGPITPYRSRVTPGSDGFVALLRSEWTKFRTVRGWVVGLGAAALVMVLMGLALASGSRRECSGPAGGPCEPGPSAPDGTAVRDRFAFVHQPLEGDGSITVRVTSLDGTPVAMPGGTGDDAGGAGDDLGGSNEDGGGGGNDDGGATGGGAEPWAKAGLIVKDGTEQGSAYAAVMVTPGHGVRMQSGYTEDTAGLPGAVSASSPRWLRLTREGDLVTGYESADGTTWSEVGSARIDGLPPTVQAGMFVASPDHVDVSQSLGEGNVSGYTTMATATFDEVATEGGWHGGAWARDRVGDDDRALETGGVDESGGTFTVQGTGDIGPVVNDGSGGTVEQTLVGAFGALMGVIVVGALFVAAEYRQGLARTTLAASPRRGRVLAAKAVVLGSVTFAVGLVAATVARTLGGAVMESNGRTPFPVGTATEVRVVVGTAALLAVAAVFALAVGTVMRRSAGAAATVIVLMVVPYILAVAPVLPVGAARWLLRLTPAAAFAVQQSLPEYHQVANAYTPLQGYFPLSPAAGFAVLGAYTALTLALATVLLRSRDA